MTTAVASKTKKISSRVLTRIFTNVATNFNCRRGIWLNAIGINELSNAGFSNLDIAERINILNPNVSAISANITVCKLLKAIRFLGSAGHNISENDVDNIVASCGDITRSLAIRKYYTDNLIKIMIGSKRNHDVTAEDIRNTVHAMFVDAYRAFHESWNSEWYHYRGGDERNRYSSDNEVWHLAMVDNKRNGTFSKFVVAFLHEFFDSDVFEYDDFFQNMGLLDSEYNRVGSNANFFVNLPPRLDPFGNFGNLKTEDPIRFADVPIDGTFMFRGGTTHLISKAVKIKGRGVSNAILIAKNMCIEVLDTRITVQDDDIVHPYVEELYK